MVMVVSVVKVVVDFFVMPEVCRAHGVLLHYGPYNILTLCLSKNLTFIRQDNVRDTKTEYNLVVGDTEME